MAVIKIVKSKSKSKKALRSVLKYVLDVEKTKELLTTAVGDIRSEHIGNLSAQNIYENFTRVKKAYGKSDGRQYIHIIMSFAPNEINPEKAFTLCTEYAQQQWGDRYQTAIVTHIDKEHIHCHFVINSVSYSDGRKITMGPSDLQKLKNDCNQLCIEHGLSIPQKGVRTTDKHIEFDSNKYRIINDKPQKSYMANAINKIYEALSDATNYNDFVDNLSKNGYTIEENGKYPKIIDCDGHKMRLKTLEKNFGINLSLDHIKYMIDQTNAKEVKTESEIRHNRADDYER